MKIDGAVVSKSCLVGLIVLLLSVKLFYDVSNIVSLESSENQAPNRSGEIRSFDLLSSYLYENDEFNKMR